MKRPTISYNDLNGITALACDAIIGITNIVETMHQTIATRAGTLRRQEYQRKLAAAAVAYWSIRTATSLVNGQVNQLCAHAMRNQARQISTRKRESLIATLNGVLGDHLAATNNPFAIKMQFRQNGQPLDQKAFAQTIANTRQTVAVMVHGSCMSDLQWHREHHSYGVDLAQDLNLHPIYLHYNSGLHISKNGRAFATQLESLVTQLPSDIDLVFVAHSMGGLVSRSACHYAQEASHSWLTRLKKIVFLGTPHHGAPLEVGGNWVDTLLGISAYSAPLSRLGKIRSSGVTDLRYGNLLDTDWQGRDRFEFTGDPRRAVPLPTGVQCYAVAATLSKAASRFADGLIGDGLVAVHSALGRHKNPAFQLQFADANQAIVRNLGHNNMLNSTVVYETIKRWLNMA